MTNDTMNQTDKQNETVENKSNMNYYSLSSILDFTKLEDDEYIKEQNLQKIKKNDTTFILKYNKKALNQSNYKTLGLFRSVIIQNNRVLGFSPPKSLPSHSNEFLFENEQNNQYQEFVEGTMVNVFYDKEMNEWEVATRSVIGARNNFYNNTKSFRKMFLECMNETNLEFDDLNKQYSYSFIIQHPENRIVLKIDKPRLILCSVYEMDETNNVYELDIKSIKNTLHNKVDFIQTYNDIQDMEDAKQRYAFHSTPFHIVGFVIRNGVYRTKVRNPNYEYVRQLRGNQRKNQFQYLNLRQNGKVHEFLKYYPEYNDEFQTYREQVHLFTRKLQNYYKECFIYKKHTLGEFSFEYRNHLYKLHNIYLNELLPKKQVVVWYTVKNYVNQLHPALLMYSINYKLRKQNIEDYKEIKKEHMKKQEHTETKEQVFNE